MAYEELRRIAHQQRRRVGAPLTLNTTALVHEVYLKLSSGSQEREFERAHFLALAARAMRQVLIDHARSRVCLKRGGEIAFTEADENQADCSSDMADMLALDQSLTELSELDSRAGGRYRLVGEGVKQYAERLREEMDRRRLRYNRIEWP